MKYYTALKLRNHSYMQADESQMHWAKTGSPKGHTDYDYILNILEMSEYHGACESPGEASAKEGGGKSQELAPFHVPVFLAM